MAALDLSTRLGTPNDSPLILALAPAILFLRRNGSESTTVDRSSGRGVTAHASDPHFTSTVVDPRGSGRLYTRVSTTSQVGGRFDSCESQAAICREHLAKQGSEGWHEVACFTDAAYSGATLNRPGMHALKRQIEAGLVKIVLIFKMERVLRSTDEWGPFRAFLKQHGCRLVSTTEDLSEDTPFSPVRAAVIIPGCPR